MEKFIKIRITTHSVSTKREPYTVCYGLKPNGKWCAINKMIADEYIDNGVPFEIQDRK